MHLIVFIHLMCFIFYLLLSFSNKEKKVNSLFIQVYNLYLIAVMWVLLVIWLVFSISIPFILNEYKLLLIAILPICLIVLNVVKIKKYEISEKENNDINIEFIEGIIAQKIVYLPKSIKVIKVEPFIVNIGGHISGRINIYLKTEEENIGRQNLDIWYKEVKKELDMGVLINILVNDKKFVM